MVEGGYLLAGRGVVLFGFFLLPSGLTTLAILLKEYRPHLSESSYSYFLTEGYFTNNELWFPINSVLMTNNPLIRCPYLILLSHTPDSLTQNLHFLSIFEVFSNR